MKASVLTLDNQSAGELDLSDTVFAVPPRRDILARMVNWQRAKRRAGTHKVKNRAEITGTSAKMSRQKGGGRARHGNAKAPQFRGGGRAFGPVVRSHAHDLPKKVRRLALKMALSVRFAAGQGLVLDDEAMPEGRTAALAERLSGLGLRSALFIAGEQVNENFARAARNVPNVDCLPVQGANVYDILRRERLVLTRAAVQALEARLG